MKALLGILVAAQLLAAPAMVPGMTYEQPEEIAEEAFEEEPDRADEFMWFYRVYNGQRQKRLWNITRGYWMTDWIDCD